MVELLLQLMHLSRQDLEEERAMQGSLDPKVQAVRLLTDEQLACDHAPHEGKSSEGTISTEVTNQGPWYVRLWRWARGKQDLLVKLELTCERCGMKAHGVMLLDHTTLASFGHEYD